MAKHLAIAFTFITDPRLVAAKKQGLNPRDMSRPTLQADAQYDPFLSPMIDGEPIPDFSYLPSFQQKIYFLQFHFKQTLKEQTELGISFARGYHIFMNHLDFDQAAISDHKPYVMLIEYEDAHIQLEQEPNLLKEISTRDIPDDIFLEPSSLDKIKSIASFKFLEKSFTESAYPKVLVAMNVATHGTSRHIAIRPDLIQGLVHNKAFFVSKEAGEGQQYLERSADMMEMLAGLPRYANKRLAFCPILKGITIAQGVENIDVSSNPRQLQQDLFKITRSLSQSASKYDDELKRTQTQLLGSHSAPLFRPSNGRNPLSLVHVIEKEKVESENLVQSSAAEASKKRDHNFLPQFKFNGGASELSPSPLEQLRLTYQQKVSIVLGSYNDPLNFSQYSSAAPSSQVSYQGFPSLLFCKITFDPIRDPVWWSDDQERKDLRFYEREAANKNQAKFGCNPFTQRKVGIVDAPQPIKDACALLKEYGEKAQTLIETEKASPSQLPEKKRRRINTGVK